MSNQLVEYSQDIQSVMRAGKWIAIIGTGYLLAKNPRVGWAVLTRSAWAVATASVRLGITIGQIWWEQVFRPAIMRPPPPPPVPPGGPATPARPIIDIKPTSVRWKPPKGGMGGGATAFFLFGGILVQTIVNAEETLEDWFGDPYDPNGGQFDAV
jgi:hypothetical protein